MKTSKLITLLQHFSTPELKQLKSFVDSPFFNKNQNLKKLISFIQIHAPSFEGDSFTYQEAYIFVFKNEAFKKDKVIKLMSKLFSLTEQFIIHTRVKKNEVSNKLQLLKYYNQQNLAHYFEMTFAKIKKRQKSSTIKNNQWSYHQFQLEREYAAFLGANADDGTGDINLQTTNNALDIFYLEMKLKYLCCMKNRQRLTSFSYEFTLQKELEIYFQNNPLTQEPLIVVWRNAYHLLSNQDSEEHYHALKSSLEQFASQIEIIDKRLFYTYLENTAKFVFPDFFEELFSLYQIQIKQGIFYTNSFFGPPIFKNIVTVALRLNKLDWTTDFIETHYDKIVPDNKEKGDIYFLCLALLLFEKGKYDDALDILNQAKMVNLYIKLEERRLRLKIYFEMDYHLPFEDGINSFRKFLSENRKDIADYWLEANRNFLNTVYYLFKTIKNDKKRLHKLKSTIEATNVLPDKTWILKKLGNRHCE